MRRLSLSSFALLVSLFARALGSHGQGLIGYGQWWYDPKCCYSCRGIISGAPLDCPAGSMDGMDMRMGMDMDMDMDMTMSSPTAPCIAENAAFLTTLAYCINSTCPGNHVPAWKIERYWADQATGDSSISPMWTYGAALANVTQAPTEVWETGAVLNYTALLSPSDYEYQNSFNNLFDWEEAVQSTYVIIIITVGVGTPVLISLLGHLPYISSIFDKLKPYVVYPSTIGTYNLRPLPWLLGNAPTAGQALYIGMFIALNVVLGAVSYRGFDQPHPWGFTHSGEIMAYVGYRTGHISFALLPLTVLFSSRNNVLLWLTNWPYSTFIVLHRWVARICALQAMTHSITLLGAYISSGTYSTEVHEQYWIWGIVATLCLVVLLFQSMLWFRRASYEIFLVLHILLSVFVIAGCWYHVMYWHGFTGIYEYWIYAVSAVWFFDRLVRVLRVWKNGICRATVTEINSDMVRVDIKGLEWTSAPGHHAFVYFPTLSPLRPWENHPFSILHTTALRSKKHEFASSNDTTRQRYSSDGKDIEEGITKDSPTADVKSPISPHLVTMDTNSVTLYIKKHTGVTSFLQPRSNLPVLVDGPYRSNPTSDVLKSDRILLIAGGIGITGVLPLLTSSNRNTKLFWSLKTSSAPLLQDLSLALDSAPEKDILVGKRLDVEALLEQEARVGWHRVGVVVCGPQGLCDAVRAAVVRCGRKGKTVFELEIDAFSW
ncbi:hypothetical protein AAE478_001245 [Parahypoxylon ruwenzoriense]